MKRNFVVKNNGKLKIVPGKSDARPENFMAVCPPNFVPGDEKFCREIDGKIVFNHAAMAEKDKKDFRNDLWNSETIWQRIKRAFRGR